MPENANKYGRFTGFWHLYTIIFT